MTARLRLVLVAGLAALAAVAGAMPAGARSATPRLGHATLPSGWELCILQGLGAPLTSANVADLDQWQAAEGGSTANDIAYNPFNTMRSTDHDEATLPAAFTSSGFPAFATWVDGCAATVATILQPNMAPIATALVAGNVTPPAAFLAVVDQTPWCAPSDGVPCYMSVIGGLASPTASGALDLYQATTTAVTAYDGDVRAASAIEAGLAEDRQQLAVDDVEVSLARFGQQQALGALRKAVVYDYTSNPSLDQMANLVYFQTPTQRDLLGQLYSRVDLANLVGRYRTAGRMLASAQAGAQAATDAVSRDSAELAAAQDAVGQALGRADLELVALQAAGACGGTGTASSGPTPVPTPGTASVAALRSCLSSLRA